MIFEDYALYVQSDQSTIYSDIVLEETFVIGVSSPADKKDQVKGHLYTLASQLQACRGDERQALSAVDSFRGSVGNEHLSLTVLMLDKDRTLLITRGQGVIYLFRGDTLHEVISGDKHAKGAIRQGDYIACSTKNITAYFTHQHLQSVFDGRSSQEIMDELQSELFKTQVDQLFIVLSNFSAQAESTEGVAEPLSMPVYEPVSAEENMDNRSLSQPNVGTDDYVEDQQQPPAFESPKKNLFATLPPFGSFIRGRRNAIILISIVLLLLALVGWSVFFGTSRRAQKVFDDRAAITKESVESKIKQARDTALLDINQAVSLLNEAKSEVDALENYASESHIKNTSRLDEIRAELESAQKAIEKKNESASQEYYDFALIDKQATGDTIYRDGDGLIILDRARAKVYVLSAGEKSADEYVADGISKPKKAIRSKDRVFVLSDDGIFEVFKKGNAKNVIKSDGWGAVADISSFNGNVYVLDPEQNAIYKYLVASDGFSDKRQYLSGGTTSKVHNGNAIAIDSAVYISTPETVHKFLSGSSEPFAIKSPDQLHIDDIFTADDSDDVYVMDKTNKKIAVFSKDGAYKKQIISESIKTALDMIVLKDGTILLLEGSKLVKLQ